MPLSDKVSFLLFDSRLIERNLRLGKINQNSLKKHLSSLDDLSNEHDLLDIEDLLKELKKDGDDELSAVDGSEE